MRYEKTRLDALALDAIDMFKWHNKCEDEMGYRFPRQFALRLSDEHQYPLGFTTEEATELGRIVLQKLGEWHEVRLRAEVGISDGTREYYLAIDIVYNCN